MAPDPDDAPYPPPAVAWGTVAALLLAFVVSFLDRQILSLLVGPIKRDLGLSDTAFSLLAGLAFALFFTFMGLPFGRLADRAARRLVIVLGTVLGGLSAVAAGVSGTFAQLFGARAFAGTADAAIGPAAYSMLADLFPPRTRARAFSVYSLGIYIGAGLAFGAGGLIVGAVAANPTIAVPVFGEVRGWQAVFLAIALPAFIAAPLLLLIPEPARRGATEAPLPIRETVRYVWARRGLFLPYFIGFGVIVTGNFATLAWTPELFIRRFGFSPRDAGVTVGLTMAAAGSLGVLAGGWFADHLAARGRRDGVLVTGMVAAAAITVFGIAFPLMPTPGLAHAALAPLFFSAAFASGAAPSAIAAVTPNRMRGQVSALYLLVIYLLGTGFGPTLPALFTDFVYQDESRLGWSLATSAALIGPPAFLLLNAARPRFAAQADTAAAPAAEPML